MSAPQRPVALLVFSDTIHSAQKPPAQLAWGDRDRAGLCLWGGSPGPPKIKRSPEALGLTKKRK